VVWVVVSLGGLVVEIAVVVVLGLRATGPVDETATADALQTLVRRP
jgi:hypothetical protein